MGFPVSHGCVRMEDIGIYWLYNNIPVNTTVSHLLIRGKMTLNGYRHTPSPDFLMRKTDREGKRREIAEYVVNHGKFSFSDVPFGPADSLVFSILSYLTPEAVFPDFDGRQKMPLKRLAQLYERHYVPPKHPGRFSMEARAPELLVPSGCIRAFFGNCGDGL